MKKIFGFDEYLQNFYNYRESATHTYLIIGVIIFCAVLLLILPRKNIMAKKIIKICLAIMLAVLELGRIIYRVSLHLYLYGSTIPIDWWKYISFHMCAIMTWLTVITLLLSAFLKKENKLLQIFYNILFGISMFGAIVTFSFNDFLTMNRSIYHFINIQTIITHALLILVPLYLIKTGDFKPEIKNFWNIILGYVFIGAVALTASHISGHNFAFSLYNTALDKFGITLTSDWHLFVTFSIMSLASLLLYGVIELFRFLINYKKPKRKKIPVKKNNLVYAIRLCLMIFGLSMGILLLAVFIPAMFETSPLLSYKAVVCLLPFIYVISVLLLARDITPLITADSLSTEITTSFKKYIVLCVLMTILALPAGIMFIIQLQKIRKTTTAIKN